MASFDENVDNRTRELSDSKVEPGKGLKVNQEAQNQLQAIQNERRNNLMEQRAQLGSDANTQELLGQAATMATESAGPSTVATLSKYGLSTPRVIKKEGHDIKTVPPNITITNNYNTTTTNSGPVQGRDIAFKEEASTNNQGKFKAWLSGLFLQQKENNSKREREYSKRESMLVRSSNKMLKLMQSAGEDIATNMNPRNIGKSVGNQLRILFMIFALRFLAKHWNSVLTVLEWIGDGITKALDYFGVTEKGRRMMAQGGGFRGDVISFFGGDPRKENLFQVFKRLGTDLIDYLKMKLDHAMELRGDAIKAIKFPSLGGDISSMLTGIAGYLGSILTALVDPVAGLKSNISNNLEQAGLRSITEAQTNEKGPKRNDSAKWVEGGNTSEGDAALIDTKNGKRRYSLLEGSLQNGKLADNAVSEASQSMDLLGAIRDARDTGKIETARVASGFQRMSDRIKEKGSFLVDPEFLKGYFGSEASALMKTGHITKKQFKFVKRPKTQQELYDENAVGAVGGALKMGTALSLGNAIDNKIGFGGQAISSGVVGVGTGGYASTVGSLPIIGKGFVQPLMIAGGALRGAYNKATVDKNTLELVPNTQEYSGMPAVAGPKGRAFTNLYSIDEYALQQLSNKLFHTKEIDTKNKFLVKNIERMLTTNAGGAVAAQKRYESNGGEGRNTDFNIEENFQPLTELTNDNNRFTSEENNSKWSQAVNTMSNNASRIGQNIYNAGADMIGYAGKGAKWLSKTLNEKTLKKAKYVTDRLQKEAGLTKEQASGVVGHLYTESGLNAEANHIDSNGLRSGGLAQWNGTSFNNLKRYSGGDWANFKKQTDFLIDSFFDPKLYHAGPTAYSLIKQTTTPDEAAQAFSRYELYAGYQNPNCKTSMERRSAAVNIYNKLNGTNIPAPTQAEINSYDGDSSSIPSYSASSNEGNGGALNDVGNSLTDLSNRMKENNPFHPKTEGQMRLEKRKSNIANEANRVYDNPLIRKTIGTSNYNDFEKSWVGKSYKERSNLIQKAKQYNWAMNTWKNFKTDYKRKTWLEEDNADSFARKIVSLGIDDYKKATVYYNQIAKNLNKSAGFKYDEAKKKNKSFDIVNVEGAGSTEKGRDDLNKKLISLAQEGRMDEAKSLLKSSIMNEKGPISPTYSEGGAKGEKNARLDIYNRASDNLNRVGKYFRHQDSYEKIDKAIEKNKKDLDEATKELKKNPNNKKLKARVENLKKKSSDLILSRKAIGSEDSKLGDIGVSKEDKKSRVTQDTLKKIDSLSMQKAKLKKHLDELNNKSVNLNDPKEVAALSKDYKETSDRLYSVQFALDATVGKAKKNIKGQRENIRKLEVSLGRNMDSIENEYAQLIKSGKSHNEAIIELQKKYGEDVIAYLNQFGKKILEIAAQQQAEFEAALKKWYTDAGLNPDYPWGPMGIGSINEDTPVTAFAGNTLEEKEANKAKIVEKNRYSPENMGRKGNSGFVRSLPTAKGNKTQWGSNKVPKYDMASGKLAVDPLWSNIRNNSKLSSPTRKVAVKAKNGYKKNNGSSDKLVDKIDNLNSTMKIVAVNTAATTKVSAKGAAAAMKTANKPTYQPAPKLRSVSTLTKKK